MANVSASIVPPLVAVLLTAVVACGTTSNPGSTAAPVAARVIDADGVRITLGEQITLLHDGELGLQGFPDFGVASIGGAGRTKLLVGANRKSYLIEGKDLLHLNSATEVLALGSKGSFDNGQAGIGAAYADKSGTLYAVYHAEDHEGMSASAENGLPGFYGSLAIAVSKDGGGYWAKLGQVITSGTAKDSLRWPDMLSRGVEHPGLVAEKGGRYLYLYYTDLSHYGRSGPEIAMARADLSDGPPLPGQWYKYDGHGFTERGIGGKDTPLLNPAYLPGGRSRAPTATYSSALDEYLMVYDVDLPYERQFDDVRGKISGIYLARSSDGIVWREPTQLVSDYVIQVTGKSLSRRGTILWDASDNGSAGWLVYCHSPKWGTYGGYVQHYMVGRRIKLERIAT